MRFVKAAGAALILVLLAVAPPWLLITYIGNPWPAEGVSWDAPLTDGALTGLLAVVVWVLWAQLMVCVVAEAIAAITRDRVQLEAPLTMGVQRQLARRLITAVLVTGTVSAGGGAAFAAPAPATTPAPQASAPQAGQDQCTEDFDTVTVQRLDSLWSIAEEHFGDGERWDEIAALNEGRVMGEGAIFRTADALQPGWVLRIPTTTASPAAEEPAGTQHRVVEGDNLSKIALEESGDANQWRRIYQASKDITQPGGGHLVDPDHIEPGWVLQVPGGTSPAAEQPAAGDRETVPPADHEPVPGTQAPEEHTNPNTWQQEPPVVEQEDPAVVEETAPVDTSAQSSGEHVDEVDQGWPVRTIGGVGSLLAAAVLALVAVRRRRQRQHRPPGVAMPLPASSETEAVERDVRAVGAELDITMLDNTLRALALTCTQEGVPIPQVRVVRLTRDQVDLCLHQVAELPAPWQATSDPTVWVLSAADAGALEPAGDVPAPFPALVTVGYDDQDGAILLNLELVGGLALTGTDQDSILGAVRAIALEVGAVTWSADLDVVLSGDLVELPRALEAGRVRYVPALEDLLEDQPAPGGGRLVITTETVAAVTVARLRELGHALVLAGQAPGEWALELVDVDQAVLHPLGLPLAPQLVDDRTYAGLLDVLDTSQVDPRTQTAYDKAPNGAPAGMVVPFDSARARVVEELVDEGTAHDETSAGGDLPPVGDEGLPATDKEPDELDQVESRSLEVNVVTEVDPVDEVLVDDPDIPPTQPQEPADVAGEEDDQTADERQVDGDVPVPDPISAGGGLVNVPDDQVHPLLETGHPVIRILRARADIIGTSQAAPSSESHWRVCTRIAVYMGLNPDKPRSALVHAVWGGKETSKRTVDPRISQLRTWLGTNPDTGVKYQPPRTLRIEAPATTDWDIYQSLVGEDPRTASTEALEHAFSLVSSAPLSGEKSEEYGFAEYDTERILSRVVDTAYELARRRYMEGRWAEAGEIAAQAVENLDPVNESVWRLRIHAAHSAGSAHRVLDQMRARLLELGFEADGDTVKLVEAIGSHDTTAIAHARAAL